MCLWGGLFTFAVHFFLKSITSLSAVWRLLTSCVVGLAIAPIAVRQITPDLILAACLFGYFALIVNHRLFESRLTQLAAGAIAGICFVAKAYALPFLLLHLPMTILLRRGTQRPQKLWSAFATISLTFAILCAGWISVLSWRYRTLTVNSSGKYAHAIVGPAERQKLIPTYFGSVDDPYITRNEVIETIPYPAWSPFESRAYFNHQCDVVKKNAESIYRTVVQFDPFRMTLIGIGALIVILASIPFLRQRFIPANGWTILWLIASAMIYCSGFLPVFFVPRYIMPVVLPLCLILCLKISAEVKAPKFIGVILSLIVLASFALAAVEDIRSLVSAPHKGKSRQVSQDAENSSLYREVAQEMRDQGILGPIVSPQRVPGIYVAFHSGQKFTGFPPDEDIAIAEQKIAQFNPGAMIIFKGSKDDKKTAAALKMAGEMVHQGLWKLTFVKTIAGEKAEVYLPRHLKVEATH